MSNSIQVREARQEDADIIVGFNTNLASETEDLSLDPVVLREGVETALSRSDLCRYFVAERNGEVVGQLMITYEWSDWRNRLIWWIQSVYVHADHRRNGVYAALHTHVENLAREEGNVCLLRLHVERDNVRAMAVYEKMGMTQVDYVPYQKRLDL